MEVEIRLRDDGSAGDHVSAEEIAYLVAELDALALHSVAPVPAGPAPEGTRAGEAWEAGAVLVTMGASPLVLRSLVHVLEDWLARRNSGSIEMKLGDTELRMASVGRAEQRKAIEGCFARCERAEGTTTTGSDG